MCFVGQEKGVNLMKLIARWFIKGNGYAVRSPGSNVYDLYFSTEKQMRDFANEMGWKLRRA